MHAGYITEIDYKRAALLPWLSMGICWHLPADTVHRKTAPGCVTPSCVVLALGAPTSILVTQEKRHKFTTMISYYSMGWVCTASDCFKIGSVTLAAQQIERTVNKPYACAYTCIGLHLNIVHNEKQFEIPETCMSLWFKTTNMKLI